MRSAVFWLALKLHRKNPYDLCFAWSAVPAGAVALALKRISGLRYILRVCGPDIPGFERRYQTIHFLIAPLIRRIWRGADRLIAKSAREIEMIHAVDPQRRLFADPQRSRHKQIQAGSCPCPMTARSSCSASAG